MSDTSNVQPGVKFAQENYLDPEVVVLSPDNVPDGTYFIGVGKGKVYKVKKWAEDGGSLEMLMWLSEKPSLEFVRAHPQPDNNNCAEIIYTPSGEEVIVIGDTPVGNAARPPLEPAPVDSPVTQPDPEEEQLAAWADEAAAQAQIEEEKQAQFEEASAEYDSMPPEQLEEKPEEQPEAAEKDGEDGDDGEEEPEEGTEEDAEEEVDEDADEKDFLYKLEGVTYDADAETKRAWLGKISEVIAQEKRAVSLKELARIAADLGVWEDAKSALRSLRPMVREFIPNNPGFYIEKNLFKPPIAPPAEPGIDRVRAVQEALPPPENLLDEEFLTSKLGVDVTEKSFVQVALLVPVKVLTPDRLKILKEWVEG